MLTTTIHNEDLQGTAYQAPQQANKIYTKYFYIESYGCAMNFADSEVVASILQQEGYGITKHLPQANLILVNTCSIREKAEQTVRKRLTEFKQYKRTNPSLIVGVLGCMAERLKTQFLEEEKLVDIVVGPDAYRTLPSLIADADTGQKGVNVLLSREETYADITPIRLDSNGVSAFVSIMRGCNNMCSFCVVPFTRGRERSRPTSSIITECNQLYLQGYKEVTLLGQNVDSYNYDTTNFAQLLQLVAESNPKMRVRFSTSHPKDITDAVLETMVKHKNICKHIHLPVQSGSSRVLQLMNRTYTREWYLQRVQKIKELMPNCAITGDVIAGFCTETESDHTETLTLMQQVGYEMSYMYYYSERPGTLAQRQYADDVALEIKKRRLQEIVDLQGLLSTKSNMADVGKTFEVLIDSTSKKSDLQWAGRNEHNKVIIFDKSDNKLIKGNLVKVLVTRANRATLFGSIIDSY